MIGIATISNGGIESGEIKTRLSQGFGGEVGELGRLNLGFPGFFPAYRMPLWKIS
jgi:hypothetical protein